MASCFFTKKSCNCEKVSKFRDYDTELLCKNYLKIFWLKKIVSFAEKHSNFNENPILRFFVYLILSVIFVYFLGTKEYGKETIKAIGQGFFVAPLINLMISKQEKIIEMFVSVFSLQDKASKDEQELDSYSQKIRKSLLNCKSTQDSFGSREKEMWELFSTASIQAIKNRENFKRLNNQTLLITGFLLIIGYSLFILEFYAFALAILIFSFLTIINRLLLGLRSITKYYLIFKVSSLLEEHMREKVKDEFENSFSDF